MEKICGPLGTFEDITTILLGTASIVKRQKLSHIACSYLAWGQVFNKATTMSIIINYPIVPVVNNPAPQVHPPSTTAGPSIIMK